MLIAEPAFVIVVQICSLLRGGIGERGGVRVGHRIIEINGHSMVAMPHERIVHLLATSVGEVGNSVDDISNKMCGREAATICPAPAS